MHTSTYNTQGARGLGWASLAIGLTEIAAPRQVQAMLGLEDRPDHRGVLRILGIREIVHGFHILTEKRPTSAMATGLWARVAGDVLDTALLGVAAQKTKDPSSFAATSAAVMGIGLLDLLFAKRLQKHHD